MGTQQVFDLTELDSNATNLDLLIATAKMFQVSTFEQPAIIACLVDEVRRIIAEGILNEDFTRQLGREVITMRAIRRANVDFANRAEPAKFTARIDDHSRRAIDRLAHRDRRPLNILRLDLVDKLRKTRLRRSVNIE